MPTQSLQKALSCVAAMAPMTVEARSGITAAITSQPISRVVSPSRMSASTARHARNANTAIAGSEMGSPPQSAVRKKDE